MFSIHEGRHLQWALYFALKKIKRIKEIPPLSPHSVSRKACQKRKETSSLRYAETRVFLLLCKGERALDAKSPLFLDFVVRIHAYPQFLVSSLEDLHIAIVSKERPAESSGSHTGLCALRRKLVEPLRSLGTR